MDDKKIIEELRKDLENQRGIIIGDDILPYVKQALAKQKEEFREIVEEDLKAGKFYRICSNEINFKDYISETLDKL